MIDSEEGVTAVFITTQIKWKTVHDVFLEPSSGNGFKKESLLRLNKIATVDKKLIIGRLGTISMDEMEIMNEILRKLLKI